MEQVYYLWPDDWTHYNCPLNGYYWVPSPDEPNLYISTRRLEPGEQQELPGGVTVGWWPVDATLADTKKKAPLHMRRTSVYRCFDAAGQLLYVGTAVDPERRWKAHSSKSPWWPEVARKEVEWHGSRADALLAEAIAIHAERPKHNIAGK